MGGRARRILSLKGKIRFSDWGCQTPDFAKIICRLAARFGSRKWEIQNFSQALARSFGAEAPKREWANPFRLKLKFGANGPDEDNKYPFVCGEKSDFPIGATKLLILLIAKTNSRPALAGVHRDSQKLSRVLAANLGQKPQIGSETLHSAPSRSWGLKGQTSTASNLVQAEKWIFQLGVPNS